MWVPSFVGVRFLFSAFCIFQTSISTPKVTELHQHAGVHQLPRPLAQVKAKQCRVQVRSEIDVMKLPGTLDQGETKYSVVCLA